MYSMSWWKVYKDKKSASSKWLKLCFSLPALDADLVGECFSELVLTAPRACKPFIDYLNRWYMKPNSRFPPSMWAGLSTSKLPATNNGLEAFHRHYNRLFPSPHPNIRIFFDKIEHHIWLTKVKSRGCKPYKAIVKDNSAVHQKVRENKMSFKEFLLYMQDSMQPASAKLKKPSNQPPRFNLRKRKR